MIALPMRVWDKRNKKMIYLPPLMPVALLDGSLLGLLTTIEKEKLSADAPMASNIQATDYAVMYATGKLDTEGKLVYDGDILECDVQVGEEIGFSTNVKRNGVMGWKADMMSFTVFLLAKEGEVANTMFRVGAVTIKGNVWEHPELAKGGMVPSTADVIRETSGDCGITDPAIRCKMMRCASCDPKPTENKA